MSPGDLVFYAATKGMTHLALTDHDTVSGIAEAKEASAKAKITFLAGVEISAYYDAGTMHILGYDMDNKSPEVEGKLNTLRKARNERNPKIIKHLNDLGFRITLDEVAERSGGQVIGRPVMAKLLFEKGYVSSVQEAFDRYLAKGRPCYVDKFRFEPEEAVGIINDGGGIAVLAHPFSTNCRGEELFRLVEKLKGWGLSGLECFYRNHTEEDEKELLSMAERLNLVATGGSDFHGSNRPGVEMGTGEGRMRVPFWVWENLMKVFSRKREERSEAGGIA